MNYENMIGKNVRKMSGEAFDNGEIILKVKRLTVSPTNDEKDAFMFYGTSEIVDADMCNEVVAEIVNA